MPEDADVAGQIPILSSSAGQATAEEEHDVSSGVDEDDDGGAASDVSTRTPDMNVELQYEDDEVTPADADDDRQIKHDVEDDLCQTALTDRPNAFTFTLSSTEFKRFVGGRMSRGLVRGWSEFMYQHFHAVYPSCALTFYYNHCRQQSSQKSNSPFWVGKARCRTGNCIEVTMSIQDDPVAEEDVRVDVEVTGVCQHVGDAEEIVVERPNRRQLRTQQRAESADLLTSSQQSATELHYRRLGEMS